MNIVFFGTPNYVIPVLESLHKNFKGSLGESPISAVVTQKPQPSGRKKLLTYSAVDQWAFKRKIPKFFTAEEMMEKGIKANFAVLESYGNILKKEAIEYFPKGIINIHPSLLPRWRGASPVPATIIAGDEISGGSAILLDEEIDHGPVISYFKEEVNPTDTTEVLRDRIFLKAAEFLVDLITAYLAGKINLKKQDDTKATYTNRITKEDGFIPPKILENALSGKTNNAEWKIPFIRDFAFIDPKAGDIERFIRAMQPWPSSWTSVRVKENDTKRLKILKAHLEENLLVLDIVQLEGKNPVPWLQFIEGYPQFYFD